MKILVTGAAGFIGSHTCERLVGLGHQVVGVDAFDGYLYPAAPKRANAAELARLDRERFRLVEADICDASAMNALLDEGVDVVCHLAALAGVRPSIVEPLRYIRANLHGTTVILEGMRARGMQRLVFASSSSVYGVRAEPGQELAQVAAFREDDPCLHPASPYAATKRAGEMLCSIGKPTTPSRWATNFLPRQRGASHHSRARATGEAGGQDGASAIARPVGSGGGCPSHSSCQRIATQTRRRRS